MSLQTISDRSIHANHPINLDPDLVAQLLKGIEIRNQELGLQTLIARYIISRPRLLGRTDPVPRSTACGGLTYGNTRSACRVSCRRLHTRFCIRIFDHGNNCRFPVCLWPTTIRDTLSISVSTDSGRTSTCEFPINRLNRDSSGLQDHVLLFTPKAAQRPDSFDPPTGGESTDRFLAVDYQLLQHASPTLATTGRLRLSWKVVTCDYSRQRPRAPTRGPSRSHARRKSRHSGIASIRIVGGGNPQRRTAIHSRTTRQPAHRTSQPEAENHPLSKACREAAKVYRVYPSVWYIRSSCMFVERNCIDEPTDYQPTNFDSRS